METALRLCYDYAEIKLKECIAMTVSEIPTAYLVMYVLSLIFGAAFLIAFLKQRVKKATAKAAVTKAAVSVCFILSWLVLAAFRMSPFAAFIGGGLLFGLLGDIWLDLKFCYKEDSDFFTKMGFLSFAVGHFFYIAAVVSGTAGGFRPLSVLPSVGVAVLVGLVVFFGEKVMGLSYGAYKMISTLYGALLFGMTAFALFSAIFSGIGANPHLIVMTVGGVLFAVSDLILSGTYFGEGKNRPVDIITNHVTYYLAQFVIAGSLLAIPVSNFLSF